jgi:hypothetical protein
VPPVLLTLGDALDLQRIAEPQDHGQPSERGENLAQPLEVIRTSLVSVRAAKERFPSYQLARLVGARLELYERDLDQLSCILGTDVLRRPLGALRPFDGHLRYVIARYHLGALFNDDGHAPYHHSIRPTGYDFYCDEVDPTGMEQWRVDYRSMPDEHQMLAASIIWLYRARKDNVWLRRVPCTWHAADAIAYMNSTGVLTDWARLFALYPGW